LTEKPIDVSRIGRPELENGEIVAVGASADLEATASRTIELGAATILPG
jgi:cytosine/adenosine deaminase-related metal-dependent hydrolase